MTRDTIPVEDLQFWPLGAHNDGLAISTAQIISIPAGATKWMVQAITQNVRFTMDGTTPTASKGFQLKAGDPVVIVPISVITILTVIEEAATSDLQFQFGR